MAELKASIRAIDPEDSTKTVALATLSGLKMGLAVDENTGGLNKNGIKQLLQAIQPVTSAKIKSISFSVALSDSDWESIEEDLPATGDPLNPEEIFTEDFSDVAVVPTLQIMNANLTDSKSVVGASIKYMADPIDTDNFETKVNTAASRINQWKTAEQAFTVANMTLSAKDEVARQG